MIQKLYKLEVAVEEEKAVEYLRTLTFKITGNLFSEKASIKDYIDNLVYYFTNILHSMPNNVYWLDRNCILRGGNDELAHKLNLKSGFDLEGLTYEQMAQAAKLPTKEFEPYRITELAVMNTGIPSIAKEEPPITGQGKTFYYLSNKTPLRNKSGDIIGVVGISTDITKLKEIQFDLDVALKKAEAANEAKTEFLENMRHDIRTPLSGIVGCAHLLQEEKDSKKITEYADDLVQSSGALLDFLNNVLDGIQVATGELPLIKKKFDVRKQLEKIIELNKSLAAEKHLLLSIDYDENIPRYLIGDPVRVQRIVLELIANALIFTEKGKISLVVKLKKKEGREVVLELIVKDTGIGIPENKQEEIFIRFKRLTPSYQGKYKGLGLGLTMVKQFIEDLDGEIYVKSHSQQGSSFICLIPFQEPLLMDHEGIEEIPLPFIVQSYKKKIGNINTHKEAETGDSRILLIEDDKLAAKIAQTILSELNCTIDMACDAKTAEQKLQTHNYKLILMDIGLPDMDGIALTHRIRLHHWQTNDSIPIVGLTAHIGQEKKQQCLDAGMNAVMLKPLKKETALELLSTFVGDEASNQSSSSASPIRGAVLDFERIKTLLEDDELIKECGELMISGLGKDLEKLAGWHRTSDWESIQAIAHKWRGAASYYGAKRLEQACEKLDSALVDACPSEKLNNLYQQLLQEIDSVIEVLKKNH